MNTLALAKPADPSELTWRWQTFAELGARELYAILMARADVFVVEQNCIYRDIDGADLESWHLVAYHGDALAAYLRILPPNAEHADVWIGRVLTQEAWRGRGLGHILLAHALQHARTHWPGVTVSLHAQAHLQDFYGASGFVPSSAVHDEDGIPHIWMRLA